MKTTPPAATTPICQLGQSRPPHELLSLSVSRYEVLVVDVLYVAQVPEASGFVITMLLNEPEIPVDEEIRLNCRSGFPVKTSEVRFKTKVP